MVMINCQLNMVGWVKGLTHFVQRLLFKEPLGSVLVISTRQNSVCFIVFGKPGLGNGFLRKKIDFLCFCRQSKKKKQFPQELFEVKLFSTSFPQVFLALSAVPKDLDLAPTEMPVFLHCCLGQIQLVDKGIGKDEDRLSQVRVLKTHVAMKMSHSSLSLPCLGASMTPIKKEMVPRHLSSGTEFATAPTSPFMTGSCSKHSSDLCLRTMRFFAT